MCLFKASLIPKFDGLPRDGLLPALVFCALAVDDSNAAFDVLDGVIPFPELCLCLNGETGGIGACFLVDAGLCDELASIGAGEAGGSTGVCLFCF
jgi:hypothetical protein